jgi:hypothetical protein
VADQVPSGSLDGRGSSSPSEKEEATSPATHRRSRYLRFRVAAYANKPNSVTTGGAAGGATEKSRPRNTPLTDPARTSLAPGVRQEELEPTEPALIGFSHDGRLGTR